MNGAIANFIKLGLEYWVKKKCESIDQIDIKINDLNIGFANSEISSLSLEAKRIVFNSIPMHKLSLKTGSLLFGIDLSKPARNIISIKNNFKIYGFLFFNQDDLNSIISSIKWSWISQWLVDNFFPGQKIIKILIRKDFLLIRTLSMFSNQRKLSENYINLSTIDGMLLFKGIGNSNKRYLPMDESIYISKVEIINKTISLKVKSIVKD